MAVPFTLTGQCPGGGAAGRPVSCQNCLTVICCFVARKRGLPCRFACCVLSLKNSLLVVVVFNLLCQR